MSQRGLTGTMPPPGSADSAVELLLGIARVLSAEAETMPKGSRQHEHFTFLTASVLDATEAIGGTDV